MIIPENAKYRFVKVWENGGGGPVPKEWEEVQFASRETIEGQVWTPDGVKPQQFAKVLNPSIWGGKIPWPPGPEFQEVPNGA